MSPDFFASYISGAVALLIGNPLDIVKVRLQSGTAKNSASTSPVSTPRQAYRLSSLFSLLRGAAAPALGSGALNSILFVTYNRTSDFLNTGGVTSDPSLWTVWVAGAIGGIPTCVISTPIELIKCRTQLASPTAKTNSWKVANEILRTEGLRGLYFGGVVTALRDSIGYGFYFWSYELSSRYMVSQMKERGMDSSYQEAAKVLLCGGLAGVVSWASIFPLDVIKTRLQMQVPSEATPILGGTLVAGGKRLGSIEIAKRAYKNEGLGVFWRGFAVCSVRAFIVNAAQFAVYEWLMYKWSPRKITVAGFENHP